MQNEMELNSLHIILAVTDDTDSDDEEEEEEDICISAQEGAWPPEIKVCSGLSLQFLCPILVFSFLTLDPRYAWMLLR